MPAAIPGCFFILFFQSDVNRVKSKNFLTNVALSLTDNMMAGSSSFIYNSYVLLNHFPLPVSFVF